ncbi:hypothetical protein [Klebsiella phage Kpn13]|uniref:Uncharacterized protein n=1 Tax=Klebsiella phage Kpn13 TaxID=3044024 RepID=A0AAT9V690_9CAUD|nr:hypothetical protein [Klebsiella phage Kpn13]
MPYITTVGSKHYLHSNCIAPCPFTSYGHYALPYVVLGSIG